MNNSLFWGGARNDLDGDLTIDRVATDRYRREGDMMVALGRGSRYPGERVGAHASAARRHRRGCLRAAELSLSVSGLLRQALPATEARRRGAYPSIRKGEGRGDVQPSALRATGACRPRRRGGRATSRPRSQLCGMVMMGAPGIEPGTSRV